MSQQYEPDDIESAAGDRREVVIANVPIIARVKRLPDHFTIHLIAYSVDKSGHSGITITLVEYECLKLSDRSLKLESTLRCHHPNSVVLKELRLAISTGLVLVANYYPLFDGALYIIRYR